MSWGYFLDVTLTLPAQAWKTISTQKTEAFPTQVGWWGMKDKELERRFVDMFGDTSKGFTFAKLVKYFADDESVGLVTEEKGAVAIRIIMLLSKDMDTDIARGVSALFEAAKEHGGAGHASLANDGTYVGENGVTVALAKGKLTRSAIKDSFAYTEPLVAQLYGDQLADFNEALEEVSRKQKSGPKKAAKKKSGPKKAAKKKSAPKKAAKKKSAPKKAAKKKSS